MGAKTTSGSGFLLRFVFSTLDLVDLAQNLKKILRDTFLRNLGSKVQKFKNYLSELQKTFHSRIFNILWDPRPSIAVPNLVRICWNFQGQTAGDVFRANFPSKLRGAMFDGLYLRN